MELLGFQLGNTGNQEFVRWSRGLSGKTLPTRQIPIKPEDLSEDSLDKDLMLSALSL